MFPMLEVVMRPPDVFVRELSPDEGLRLRGISRKAKYQSKRQRAMILLASATGMGAPQIAGLVRSDESHVRKVIHAFNEEGFGSLDPDYRGGRPKKTTPEQRDRIVSVARARPDTQGVPLTRWSLPKLQAHLAGMGVELCEEALRLTLISAGLSHQRTRSWKWSPDPDFQSKAERVLSLYRAKPEDGVVVCFDEMGPIQLIPHHGSGGTQEHVPRQHRGHPQERLPPDRPGRRDRRPPLLQHRPDRPRRRLRPRVGHPTRPRGLLFRATRPRAR
jgi:transposase